MRLYIQVDAPHRWARVNSQGTVRRHGVADNLESVPVNPRSDEVWAVIGGEELITTEVDIPTRHRRKLIQALPYALEDRLTQDIDEFHFSVLSWKPGGTAVAGVISRSCVDACRELFSHSRVRLDGLVADYQLLPIHPQAAIMLAVGDTERVSMLRNNGLGATLDLEAIELWWGSLVDSIPTVAVNDAALGRRLLELGGGDIKQWEIGSDFTEWLRHRTRNASVPNLLPRDEAARRREASIPGLRIAVVVLAIAALARVGVDAYEYRQLEQHHRQLTTEINQLFQQTFPDEERIVNVRAQFRQNLTELTRGANASGEFQTLLSVIVPAVRARDISLEEISFRDNTLEVVCAVGKFAELDNLQRSFSRPGLKVELVVSGSLADRITGRFRLSREAS
jgi:general secretion pathway protein L